MADGLTLTTTARLVTAHAVCPCGETSFAAGDGRTRDLPAVRDDAFAMLIRHVGESHLAGIPDGAGIVHCQSWETVTLGSPE